MDARIVQNVELALTCGASPAVVVAVALLTASPATLEEAVAFVRQHGAEIAACKAGSLAELAPLEPELVRETEPGRVLPASHDHEIRGRRLFGDLVGKRSFIQVAALGIDGIELEKRDAELLEHLGVNTQLFDVRIWPLNVARRVAAASGLEHGVIAGLATVLNPNMAATPVGRFMHLLDELGEGVARGVSIESQLEDVVRRGERLPGLGRPALGPDERNTQVFELARAYERDTGPSWKLAMAVDGFFARRKGVRINSAGLQGALMRDMGFTPRGATAFCTLYFLVPVVVQAAFGSGGGKRARAAANAVATWDGPAKPLVTLPYPE
ncbi:MAG TPA: hypothetical protein VH054_27200 [Polyangiaceae bacterium]|jgi:hypothetical protein|nr:hypothetical protein [Polyangiaceae bacterium]